MDYGFYVQEALKLLAQGIVALIVARWTVRWALYRYKNEKKWEQQSSAFFDLVASLSELRRIVGLWEDGLLGVYQPSDEARDENRERYARSRIGLAQATSRARLLFDAGMIEVLNELDREFVQTRNSETELDWVFGEGAALDRATSQVITAGRIHMGLDGKSPL